MSLWNNRNSLTVEQSEEGHCGTFGAVSLCNNRNSATVEQSQQCHCGTIAAIKLFLYFVTSKDSAKMERKRQK